MFSFFAGKQVRNIAVVDLSFMSASAAFATMRGVAAPGIVYSARADAALHGTGATGALRALDAVARSMVKEGAPRLRKASGKGSVDSVILLIEHPWQTSALSVKVIEKDKPFLFTKSMLMEALQTKEGTAAIVGTSLNGYETGDPVGKHVRKAELSVLSSTIDPEVDRLARRAVRDFAGAVPIRVISFPDAATYVLKGFFPHERDFLALRIGVDTTEIASVKQGRLSSIETALAGAGGLLEAAKDAGVSAGAIAGLIDKEKSARLENRLTEAEKKWVGAMHDAFLRAASEGALPRVVFLFADERVLPVFKRLLDAPELHALWLSDEPLSIMALTRGNFAPYLRELDTETASDPVLDMLCLLGSLFRRG